MRKIVSLARDFATRRQAFRIEHHTFPLFEARTRDESRDGSHRDNFDENL
jgi:hypothetical protein